MTKKRLTEALEENFTQQLKSPKIQKFPQVDKVVLETNNAAQNATSNTQENPDKPNQINEILNSPEFIEFLLSLPYKQRQTFIGLSLEYLTLHPDGYGFKKFITSCPPNKNVSAEMTFYETYLFKAFTESIAQKLNITNPETSQNQKIIFEYFYENFWKKGFYFHGFNGTFTEQIRQNGLNITSRIWDWKEIEQINEIVNKTELFSPLNFYQKDANNIYISAIGRPIYHYASTSPECFANFISNNTFNEKGWPERDLKQAKKTLEQKLDHFHQKAIAAGLDPTEISKHKRTINEFFEKMWNLLTGPESKPKIALIERVAFLDIAPELYHAKTHWEKSLPSNSMDLKKLNILHLFYYYVEMFTDIKISNNIPPEAITIIDLPEYHTIFPPEENKD